MGVNHGTLQVIGREVALALATLEAELADAGLQDLLAQLGLRLPDSLATAGPLGTAADATASSATDLSPPLAALADAVADDDVAAILLATAQLVEAIASVLAALDDLGDALDAVAATAGSLDAGQRAQVQAFASELPRRLLEHLVVRRAEDLAPQALATLAAAGLLDHVDVDAPPGDPLAVQHTRQELHLDRLGRLLSDPAQHLQDVYGWGTPAFDGLELFTRLQTALLATEQVEAVVLQPPGQTLALEAYLLELHIDDTVVPPQLAFSLRFPGTQTFTRTIPLATPWSIEVTATGAFVADVGGRISPPFDVAITPPGGTVDADVKAGLVATAAPGDPPLVLLGAPGGTRLQASKVALLAGVAVTWDAGDGRATGEPSLGLELTEGRFLASLGGADGFLSSVLPGSLEVVVDLDADWRPSTGLVFRGGAALVITVPLNLQLGPARVTQLDLVLGVDAAGVHLDARLTGDVVLGPFTAVVQGLGAGVVLRFERGNLGPVSLEFRFLPPTGLGLSIDAGPVSGGGFIGFDEALGRYSGLFQVNVGPVGVGATGLLDTRLPSGRGYALLVLLRASFPPIQVGFGFALSSVGGLLAVNRSIDVDQLRARMASGTVGRILAPEDPVRNAPVLLADLAAVFPPTEGVIVVGPTLQLSWAELVRFDVGVFIELPGPRKVVILGSARAAIENPSGSRPYLQLRLDILGVLDFQKCTVAFDAVLIDSHLLEVLELTGGAAFRLSYGADPYVVLTVGGFHPAYSPAPLVFPASLTRIAMTRGTPSDFLYFRFEGYFAVTTNTLQFGASVEVIINLSPFNIRGFLAFDALIQFEPFHFTFSIHASVKVRWKSRNLGGLDLSGELSGPGPVVFRGKVCFEILFFDICFEETFRLGSSSPPAVTPVASALAELLDQLVPRNLRASATTDRLVTVVPPADAGGTPVVSPLGQLVWTQQRAPLDLLLQKIGGAPLVRPETVTATGTLVTAPELDWFAPGGFAELSDADALSRRAFERLSGGVQLGMSGLDDGPVRTRTVKVKQIRLPAPPQEVGAFPLPAWLLQASAARTGVVERVDISPALAIHDEAWDVHGPGGAVLHAGISQAQAHQLARHGSPGAAVPQGDQLAAIAF